jgi:CubicO group peptidase (beta-lactamase class C family)
VIRSLDYPTAAQSEVMVGFPPPAQHRVTLENWQQPPYNRWSFLHTREVLPTTRISRGPRAWDLPEVPALGLQSLEFEGLRGRTTLATFLDESWTDGLIAVHRGKIVAEEYRNGMHRRTRHLAMSVSKSITSLVIGILVERGLVRLDEAITSYMPELAGSAYEGATIQQALDMQVSMSWHEDYVGTEYWRLDAACGWGPARSGAAGSLLDFMRELKPEGTHGRQTQYASPNTDLLALVAERVSGTRFADLVTKELWQPMGAEFEADLTVDPAGSAVADGGFCVALRDFARVGQLLVESGRDIVPKAWVDECLRGDPRAFESTSYGADLPGGSYHNQWWHFDGRTFALGIHGQMIAVDVEAQLVVAFVSSAPAPTDPTVRDSQRRLVSALARALG